MAKLTAELLDYSSTSIYVEPFGGGARTLLNKPRHTYEVYNDGSECLCAFMRVMSDRATAMELIDCLSETEFSREQFESARDICSQVDSSCGINSLRQDFKYWKKEAVRLVGPFSPDNLNSVKPAMDKLAKINTAEARYILNQYALLYNVLAGQSEYDFPRPPFSDIEIAAATFIMYNQSRDGMGTHFSSVKFKSQADYQKRVNRLFQAADRLEGVKVWNADAELFFIREAELFARTDVMAYMDPPYLKDTDDDDDAKNLGGAYSQQMEHDRHELFLQMVQHAGCKMLISNYDNKLYNHYLSDWTRIEVSTSTSVGGKKGNKRIEVLWYNY